MNHFFTSVWIASAFHSVLLGREVEKPSFVGEPVDFMITSDRDSMTRCTLDGTEPLCTCSYVYRGTISVQPGIQVKASACKSGMADSVMSSAK